MMRRCGLLFAVAFVLTACSTASLLPGRSQAPWYARHAGWDYAMLDTGSFFLATAAAPQRADGRPLAVYIEGDGRAFVGDRTPSADPTPATPTALRLALAHPGPAAWVARPCQFTGPNTARGCTTVAWWTSHRYAPEVVDATGHAVDDLKRRTGATRVILVGYSGGGAVAALLAARRSDVDGLVTVAANLDLAYWIRHDGLAPLTGSLDPADHVGQLRSLPQVHFSGRDDDVVASAVARSYLSRLGERTTARLVELDGFDHQCCWIGSWPDLVWRPEMAIIPGWN